MGDRAGTSAREKSAENVAPKSDYRKERQNERERERRKQKEEEKSMKQEHKTVDQEEVARPRN